MKKVVLHIKEINNINSRNQIEKSMKNYKKIKSAFINLKTQNLIITCKDDLSIDEIEKKLEELGYESLGVDLISTTKIPSITPFIILGFILIITLYFGIGRTFNLPFTSILTMNKSLMIGILFTCIFLLYGIDIVKDGVKNFLKGTSNLNTLCTISILGSIVYSIYEYYKGTNNNYIYLVIPMLLIYFMKIGTYIDKKNRSKVEREIRQLSKTKIDKVNRRTENGYEEVSVEEVRVGDQVLCLPGDKVLLDGQLIKSSTHFDESLITGESIPKEKQALSKIISDSINYENEIEYQTTTTIKDTTTSRIKKLVVNAKSKKEIAQKKVDDFCCYWIPILMVIYLVYTAVYFLVTRNLGSTITKFLQLLMISCPLGFSLMTPLTFHKNSKIANMKKLLIKKMEILEQMKRIDTVVFDKTGTITNGYLSISRINNHSELEDKELLELLGSIEKHSTHALARGITKYLRSEKIVSSLDFITEDLPGYGVKARDEEDFYYACNSSLLKKLDIINPYQEEEKKMSLDGNTVIYLVKNTKVIATIGLKDTCKKEAKKAIASLQEKGLNIILLTGDNEVVSKKIAKELGLENVVWSTTPEDKKNYVEQLIKKGHEVLVIGDGINDAPSLAIATIGIALKGASDIPTSSADILLNSSHLFKVIDLFQISNSIQKKVKQNITLSVLIYLGELVITLGMIPKVKLSPILLIIMLLVNIILVTINTTRLKTK